MEEIMLFPLSSVVLPEGKMKLRILNRAISVWSLSAVKRAVDLVSVCSIVSRIKMQTNYLSLGL